MSEQEEKIKTLVSALKNMHRYVAVERPDGLVGLAYDSHIWGPVADPRYGMFELAESVEKWLHEKIDSTLKSVGELNEKEDA